MSERSISKTIFGKWGNVAFIALLLVFLFSTGAKSWVLKQLVSVGLFNQEIKKEVPLKNSSTSHLSFSFMNATGKPATLTALKGKVVFINFWATWCPPCIAEMPSLNALYNKLKDDDRFVFLFISEDNDFSKAEAHLKQKGFDLPLARRTSGVSPEIFSGTLPTTIVLDKKGNIAFQHEGIGGYDTPAFIQQLKDLL
jgi:thiol-disulfide isomerase/thioredoxin